MSDPKQTVCSCGAQPPKLCSTGPFPLSVGWWCSCGAKWFLAANSNIHKATTNDFFSGTWIVSDEYQARYFKAVGRKLIKDWLKYTKEIVQVST